MAERFLQTLMTPTVLAAQEHYYGRQARLVPGAERDSLTDEETGFIQARDSFYMATVSENGWPYLQHRGGRPGFLHVLDPHTLAFADYRGNRQMLSTGNVQANGRATLLLMDYPRRERLKILGQARVEDARHHSKLVSQLAQADVRRLVERVFLIEVISFDWNCASHITPRYTAADIETIVNPLKQRIAELESQIRNANPRDCLVNEKLKTSQD